MAFSVQMPALGESVTEGTVTRWLKQEGEHVDVDEPLLEVSTDKVDTEIPSPAAGVLQRIVVREDETVQVGAELAVIGDGGESAGGARPPAVETPAEQPQPQRDTAEPEAAAQPEPAAEPEPEPAAEPQPAAQEPPPAGAAAPSDGQEGTAITMPALGESVTEGTVTRWLKQVGDYVAIDEPLLEVSTDKVDTEIPSPVAGTLLEITVGEEQTVEVGGQLALVSATSRPASTPSAAPSTAPAEAPAEPPAEPAAEPSSEEPTPEPPPAPEPTPEPASEPTAARSAAPAAPAPPAAPQEAPSAPAEAEPDDAALGDGAGPYVTPLVRKLAAEHNIDLSTIDGSGVGGRIRKQDVLAAAERAASAASAPAPAAPAAAAPAAAPAPAAQPSAEAQALRGTTQKLSRLRAVIAKRMVESLQVSAQLTAVVEVDVTRVARLRTSARREFEAREGVKLTFLPFFAKAAVEALKIHPKLNASIDTERGEVTYHGAEHLGIAVDTERGLIVPVIHDAGDLNIAGLARKISDLAERSRTNKVKPDELAGGTFTITNIGSRGSLLDTPIVNQPQVGILGTGAVVKRPVVLSEPDGDTIAIRSMAYLVLSYDHRLVDGADAARFLTTVKQRIEGGAFADDLAV
jgi:2-oxoglutarate dehydrogenase E2 component (dihydrolipoamide succinyltransferase)